MKNSSIIMFVLSAVLLTTSYATSPSSHADEGSADVSLVGAWRGKVQFKSGDFAAVKDLEPMWVFNAGGTMTESSNYEASPPVPPAYGVWRQVGTRQYEAKYSFFWTKTPKAFEDIADGGGWLPGGSGVLVDKISLSEDGKTFQSTIRYEIFDQAGKSTGNSGEAEAAEVTRISF